MFDGYFMLLLRLSNKLVTHLTYVIEELIRILPLINFRKMIYISTILKKFVGLSENLYYISPQFLENQLTQLS